MEAQMRKKSNALQWDNTFKFQNSILKPYLGCASELHWLCHRTFLFFYQYLEIGEWELRLWVVHMMKMCINLKGMPVYLRLVKIWLTRENMWPLYTEARCNLLCTKL